MIKRTPKILQMILPQIQWKSKIGETLYTFDDGPNSEYTIKFSQLLAKHNKKATFFIVGERAKDVTILKDLVSAGHLIGWHSQTHRSFLRLTKKERLAELNAVKAIEDKIGKKIEHFRFPYGRFLPTFISEVEASEMKVMLWSYLVSDYKNVTTQLLRKRLKGLRDDDILLYHDSSTNLENSYKALESHLKNI